MIKLIEIFSEYDASLFENDVFFQRIKSEYVSNASFSDSLFYVSLNDTTSDAFISKVGDTVTLSALDNAPFEEISEFLNIIGYSVILCEEKHSKFFCGKKTQGFVLKTKVEKLLHCKAKLLYTEDLKDVYNLIRDVFDINNNYMLWLADLSHKIRHGTANVCGVHENLSLVSCGFSLFETSDSAIISSVATDEKFRSKGFGGDVVRKLLSENVGKNVYVFIEDENLKFWYEKFGFKEYKKWSEIENVL